MNGWSQEFPRQELAFQGPGSGFSLLLKRNCSISPAGLMLAFGLIAIVTFGIAAAFAAVGAWLVLPFAGVEIVALGIAFGLNGRHAGGAGPQAWRSGATCTSRRARPWRAS